MEKRYSFLKSLNILWAILFLLPLTAMAQTSDFPNKPIQIMVGWAAGGTEDLRARSLAPTLEKVLGQPVLVVNKPGASATISFTLVKNSKPDGYTLGSASTSSVLFTPQLVKVEYNALTDFTYVAGTVIQPYGIVVRSDAPWKNFDELLDYVRKNPGKVKYAHTGIGSTAHVYMEAFAKQLNLNWVQVPFKGDAPCVTALLGGHVPIAGISSGFAPHVRSGKMRLLVLLMGERWPVFSKVPTMKEYGFKLDLRAAEVLGYFVPKDTPPQVVSKLENAFKQAVDSSEFKRAMETIDNKPSFRDSRTFTKLIHELYAEIGQAIKDLGLSEVAK